MFCQRRPHPLFLQGLLPLLAAAMISSASPLLVLAGDNTQTTDAPTSGTVQRGANAQYSRKHLRALLSSARTAQDHQMLAAYFHGQEDRFRAKEASQRQALSEYLENPTKYPSKYPTRGDVAKDLATYYGMEASKASVRAAEQEQLAKGLMNKGLSSSSAKD